MIIVLAEISSSAADIAELRQAIIAMQEATLADEPGCIGYTFASEIANPDQIRVVEQWQSMDDLKAHFVTPHMATFQQAMAAHPAKGMEVKIYEVAQELDFPEL